MTPTLGQLLIIAGLLALVTLGAAWWSVKQWERKQRAEEMKLQGRTRIVVGRRTRHEGDDIA